MELNYYAWGPIKSILTQSSVANGWTLIGCLSAEERCVAAPKQLHEMGHLSTLHMLEVKDPPNDHSTAIAEQIAKRCDELELAKLVPTAASLGLGDTLTELAEYCSRSVRGSDSVLIDISAFPKRFFLFFILECLRNPNIKNLGFTYTKPAHYPEGALSSHAADIASIPGFARVSDDDSPAVLVIAIGYVSFGIDTIIDQYQTNKLKFLLPFPPGSPAWRRNWNLLARLTPQIPVQSEVKRLNAMDMNAVNQWLQVVGRANKGIIDMVALGPKPHSVGMALAFSRLGDGAQILYAQPKVYRPDYSTGIGTNRHGDPDISVYMLRHNGRDLYS